MPGAHRHGDARVCGAGTIVSGQSTVFVNDKLWAVNGDPNDHGGGALIAGLAPTVSINGKTVIVQGDNAAADSLCPAPPHCAPIAVAGSGDVSAH